MVILKTDGLSPTRVSFTSHRQEKTTYHGCNGLIAGYISRVRYKEHNEANMDRFTFPGVQGAVLETGR